MAHINRRSWLKTLTSAGAGAVLLSPSQILAAMPTIEENTTNGMVRLSSNENPYSPSPSMKKAIAAIDPDLCRYPNSHFATLEAIIAKREGLDPSQVVVTSGSREGLKAVGQMYSIRGGEIVTCLPTYKALISYAEFLGSKIRAVPLTEELGYNLPGIAKEIKSETKMVFICNPNNPTGTLLDPGKLEIFCRKWSASVPVFVDEVYYDYIEQKGYPSMKSLISEGLDVIIARTFSKVYGLAGVRIGYMIANTRIATEIRNSLMSGTNIMGLKLAMTALEDKEFYNFSLEKNREGKRLIYSALDELNLRYLPSHTNFVFFKTGRNISEVQRAFTTEGVQVGRAFPPYLDWCRISTGTTEEVKVFVGALKKVFA